MRCPGIGMVGVIAAALACTACERQMRDMYEQPRQGAGAGGPLFTDGSASRQPPAGSVPQAEGPLAATSGGRRGQDLVLRRDAALAARAPALSLESLRRGQERYAIYCMPCHSPVGDGDGPVVRHGYPAPPSYHQPRLRDVNDRHLFDVITQGYGVMPSYADRVDVEDRWAIVGYIRALQRSQHASIAELPPSLRAALPAAAASASKGPR
jgi:mono/diheme cytochrome c family protein